MATVVLQTVGAAIGGAIAGPFGAVLGRAAGALAGNTIDQQLFSKDRVIEGPRLESTRILSSTEGTPIPKVYGRNRLSGQIIWATRFEEVVRDEETGGKGGAPGPTTRTFSYFGNFAVAICDGPISGIRRIWADAKELDLTSIEYRVYNGDSQQLPDPLIEAKQGSGNAPAYRGTAYVVFESLPLEKYGNRIPQVTFEVIRAVGKLEKDIRSISIIPGATEYGYDPIFLSFGGEDMPFSSLNRSTNLAQSDWETSIDELQQVCPNLETVSLVITWYGTDLRADACEILPGVSHPFNANWEVAGLQRHEAHLVSQVDGKAAFGGTPTDVSILRTIADLKSRGLKVVINPFLMMDIPKDNSLAWHENVTGQPAYPWRGEISCYPPPGVSSTVDKTAAARTQINSFAAKYAVMISHYANLVQAAGGVDGFLIGSELRGLTTVRDQANNFPFVEALQALATNIRSILGPSCRLTYGADWSEYFGHQPGDGSGDVYFHLDPLWAMAEIDAIGIDNYMPLSDWNNEEDPSLPDVHSIHDRDYLKSNISSAEGFDWYYANEADRHDRIRTPITDGFGSPWIFRYKDLVSWWSNQHHNRPGGTPEVTATDWVPFSKPLWFTELGCPAVNNGSNQPNVFSDEKSAQSALPWHSSGARDDLIQRRFLEAHFSYWQDPANNPVSSTYNGSMIDVGLITPWAWDARPFPWFPLDTDRWNDGANWHTGHWLNGRLGGCAVSDLIRTILDDYGVSDVTVEADGIVDGYIAPGATSARDALEPLLALYDIHVVETQGQIALRSLSRANSLAIDPEFLVQEEDTPSIVSKRSPDNTLPAEAVVHHVSVFSEFEDIGTKSRRIEGTSKRQVSMNTGMVMPRTTALGLAENWLRRTWTSREELNLSLSTAEMAAMPGDVVTLGTAKPGKWQIEAKETGIRQELTLRQVVNLPISGNRSAPEHATPYSPIIFGAPNVVFLDLPLLQASDEGKTLSHLAVSASPWARNYAVYSSPADDGFSLRESVQLEATSGVLASDLPSGVLGRWDYSATMHLAGLNHPLNSLEKLLVLNGGNLLAVESTLGSFELVQFRSANLQPDGSWILNGLLRGQLGTDAEMIAGAQVGASVVLVSDAVKRIELNSAERGIEINWRVGPADVPVAASSFTQVTEVNSGRSRKMLSPVHLKRFHSETNSHDFSWIRRSRIDADSWEDPEIPLDAASETYRVQIYDGVGAMVRNSTVTTSQFLYPVPDRINDLGSEDAAYSLHVSQIADGGSPGFEAVYFHPSP